MLDRARIPVTVILALSLFALALSIAYLSYEIAAVNRQIPGILKETQKIREEVPGILDRADSIVSQANQLGKTMGKGSVDGVIEGIIGSPFSVLSEFGHSFGSLLKKEGVKGVKKQDIQIIKAKILKLLEEDKVGEVAVWSNENTKNHGDITLLSKSTKDGEPCKRLRFNSWVKGQEGAPFDVSICQNAKGHWVPVDEATHGSRQEPPGEKKKK